MEVLPEEVAAQEMVVTQEEVVAQDMVVAQEKIVTQEMVVTQEKIVTQEMAVTQMEVVAQEEVVTQDEVPQAIGDTLIEDAPKLATITESPTKATGSLVDKVLWKGTPLKELTFESDAKQQQLLNTIHQLEKIDAVKTRFIYVSTFLTSMETLARPWHPKYHHPQDGEKTAFEPAYRTSIETLAIVRHLFCARTNQDSCTSCESPNSEGPSAQCVVPDLADGKGECTNCQYRGRGNQCSLRVEREKRLKAEQARLSPRKSPTKAQVAAAAKAAGAVSEENRIVVSADDLLQVKEILDGRNRGMLWKIANPGKRLPKNF